MKNSHDEAGKRADQVASRNAAIEAGAMSLAKERSWPSPSAVAKKTEISLSVVERETEILNKARRLWVKLVGHDHTHWKDPEQTSPPDEPPAPDIGREKTLEDQAERTKVKLARTRRNLRESNKELEEAREKIRRMSLGVRPAEVAQILESGSQARP